MALKEELDLMFRNLVAARLKIEFTYYKMVADLEEFVSVWGVGDVLCNIADDSLVLSF